jgi:predicted ATP-grasp superfamily ATP-dependent carboligase
MREHKGAVLVTDGGAAGSRDCIAAVRALHAASYEVDVTISEGTSRQAVSRYVRSRHQIPGVNDRAYPSEVERIAASGGYVTILPVSEASLRALSSHVPLVAELSDKDWLERAASRAGLAVPESRSFSSVAELLSASPSLSYPVAVKPLVRTFTAFRAGGAKDLDRVRAASGPVMVQPWIEGELRALSGIMWKGRLVASCHERWLRVWPWPAGLACAAVTTGSDPALEASIERLLAGYEGIFCAQLVSGHLFDLNLRIHSSHSLAVAAGANLVAIYCDLLRGASVPELRARPGHFYRWLEGDLRHVLKAWRSHRMTARDALGALRPRAGAAHSTESITDPAPMLVRLLYGAARTHLSEEERRGLGVAHGAERLLG